MNKKPWTTLKSKIIHKNPWYHLRHDEFVRLDGSTGNYYLVEGFHGAFTIALDNDEKIHLVEQTKYAIGKIKTLEVVSGGLKDGEDPLERAKTELQEEAGLKAKHWELIGTFYPFNSIVNSKNYIYIAKDLEDVEHDHEQTEDISIIKATIDECVEFIKQGKISDGESITTIYKYILYKEDEKNKKRKSK